jgi:DNA primase
MGTALTPAQTDLLARHAPVVIVAYDGDEAGRSAAKKAFALLVARGVAARHLLFPEKHDPDSFLAAYGREALSEAVEEARPFLDSLVAEIPPQGGEPTARAQRIAEALEIVKAAPERLVRYELLAGLSRGTGVPVSVLTGASGKKPRERSVDTSEGPGAEPELPGAEKKVLSILLSQWPTSAPLVARIPPDVFSHPSAREVFEAVKRLDPNASTLDFSGLQSHLGAGAGLVVARLLLQETEDTANSARTSRTDSPGSKDAKDGSDGLGRLHKPLMQLKIRQLEERGAALLSEIQAAEKAGDSGRQLQLSAEKSKLAGEISRLRAEWKRHPNESGGGE